MKFAMVSETETVLAAPVRPALKVADVVVIAIFPCVAFVFVFALVAALELVGLVKAAMAVAEGVVVTAAVAAVAVEEEG